ncbi:MAG TPA: hypothetical protein VEB64_17470 [Azospirillaceae bacterium]|nr:hypothetical protein [Azospirillaceae bacterium]
MTATSLSYDAAWENQAATPARQDRIAQSLLWAVFISVSVFQRFAIRAGEGQIAIAFVLSMAALAVLLISGRISINPLRLVMFCWMSAMLVATLTVALAGYSVASMALMLAIALPYVFQIRRGMLDPLEPLRQFRTLVSGLAVLGVVQFFAQFVVGQQLAYPLDTFLPKDVFLDNFNTLIPLYDGFSALKANGVFLLEPSHFSQFVGMALVIELMVFASTPRLVLFVLALFVSFSGTGTSMVALFAPIVLVRQRRYGLLLVGVLGILAIAAAGSAIHLDIFLNRLQEFTSTRASGFARFVGPFWFLGEYLFVDPMRMLFGMGAGSITAFLKQTAYFAHDTSWAKLMFEYGLVGFFAYMTFFVTAVFHRSNNLIVSGMIFYTFVLLGGYLLTPYMHCLFLALSVWHRPATVAEDGVRA